MLTPNEAAKFDRINAETDRLRSDVEMLTRELGRQWCVTEALWRVLQEQHGFDETKLRAMVAAVETARKPDPRSGAPTAVPCTKCGRPQAKRHPKCIYCGAERVLEVFE